MRAKLLTVTAAGLALLALPVLAQTQAPSAGGPPPSPAADDDSDHDDMGRRHHMGARHGPWYHHPRPPPRAAAEQPRLAPGVHVRRGDLVLDLDCSIRDSVEECATAALRLIERLENLPPQP